MLPMQINGNAFLLWPKRKTVCLFHAQPIFVSWKVLFSCLLEGIKISYVGCSCWCLFLIAFSTYCFILFCNLWDVRPMYRQSQRHTYWYTTIFCCWEGTTSLRTAGSIFLVEYIMQDFTPPKQLLIATMGCFSNLSVIFPIRGYLR